MSTTCCDPTDLGCILEGDSTAIVMRFVDETGAPYALADIASITLDLHRWADGDDSVINGRSQQDVLGVNGGTYFDSLQTGTDLNGETVIYNFRWDAEPEDMPFLKDSDTAAEQTEVHILHVRFVTTSGVQKSVVGRITVQNIRRFSVLP